MFNKIIVQQKPLGKNILDQIKIDQIELSFCSDILTEVI